MEEEVASRKEWHIYVLELNQGMLYVGITTDVIARYKKHCDGQGALWTALYKPVRIIETTPTGTRSFHKAEYLETAKTIELIDRHGWRYVRGGKFAIVDEKFHLNHLANCFQRFRDEPQVSEWLAKTATGKYHVPSVVVAFGDGDGKIFRRWNDAQEFLTGKNSPHWKIFHEDDLALALRWLRQHKAKTNPDELRPIARNAVLKKRASKFLAGIVEPEWKSIATIFGEGKPRVD